MIILNLVLIGLAITLEPIPLTAFILVLASKGGVRKGARSSSAGSCPSRS